MLSFSVSEVKIQWLLPASRSAFQAFCTICSGTMALFKSDKLAASSLVLREFVFFSVFVGDQLVSS